MNRIKYFFALLISFTVISNTFSQDRDYIATDTSMIAAIKLIKGSSKRNSQIIEMISANDIIPYTPDQITEYGFKDGTVYISRKIEYFGLSKKVFLERLEHGKITLYYYAQGANEMYFIEKDSSTVIELKKENKEFRTQLAEYTKDFEWSDNQTALVNYNRKSLTIITSKYNRWDNRPLPKIKIGLVAGLRNNSFSNPADQAVRELASTTFKSNSSLFAGAFVDVPISASFFSINTGVNFNKSGVTGIAVENQTEFNVAINTTSIDIPVLIRYTFPSLKWRPYFNAGISYLNHVKNDAVIYATSFNRNVVSILEANTKPFIGDQMLGFTIGSGLQYHFNHQNAVSAEIRYNRFSAGDNQLNKTQLDFLISYSY